MKTLSGKIGKTKFGWELSLFHKLGEWKDGVTFFMIDCDWDRYICDHTPRFEFSLIVLNYTLIDLSVYNIYHVDHPEYSK